MPIADCILHIAYFVTLYLILNLNYFFYLLKYNLKRKQGIWPREPDYHGNITKS